MKTRFILKSNQRVTAVFADGLEIEFVLDAAKKHVRVTADITLAVMPRASNAVHLIQVKP